MIGMPRMTLTTTTAIAASARMPETRMSAHSKPSTVESASEPSVTMMVLRTPVSRMGMNSMASVRKRCIVTSPRLREESLPSGSDPRVGARSAAGEGDFPPVVPVERAPHPDPLPAWRGEGAERPSLQSPLGQYLFEGPVSLELGERGIDLLEQVAVALAHADADRAEDGRLVALGEPHLGEQPLLQVVGEDRIVGEASLEPPGIHVPQDVGDRVVDFHRGEPTGDRE